MDIKGLFVWTSGSVIRVIQLISTLTKLFVLCLSISWIMIHWLHGNNRILTITRITWITRCLFMSCLGQFCLYFPKSGLKPLGNNEKPKSIRSLNLLTAKFIPEKSKHEMDMQREYMWTSRTSNTQFSYAFFGFKACENSSQITPY